MLKTSTVLIAAVLLGLAVPLHAQSLGEIAAAEAARRGTTLAIPDKVFTNKDLPTPAAPATPAENLAGKAEDKITTTGTAIVATSDGTKGATDEAYWRGRFTKLQAKLDADMNAGRPTVRRLLELRAALRPNLPSFLLNGAELSRLTTEVGTINAGLVDDQQAINALREEGRQAGALPGWLR